MWLTLRQPSADDYVIASGLVRRMGEHDWELARQENVLADAGHRLVVLGVSHG